MKGNLANTPINVSELIEDKMNKKFKYNLLSWTFLLMLLEGFDVGSLSFAAPILIEQLDVTRSTFGVVFSAGTFGLMIGGFIFGFLGDIFGRKQSLMFSILMFSIFTLMTALADSIGSLIVYRFLVGLGLGGTVPLSIVLVNEYAPNNAKGRWVATMFVGFPLGMAVGGVIAAWLLNHFDWHSIFIVGGIAPLLTLVFLLYKLPESLKFLVIKNKSRKHIVKLVKQIDSTTKITKDTKFIVNNDETNVRFSPKLLFEKELKFVTPIIWVASITSSFVVYFMNSWLPTLLIESGLSYTQSSLTTSLYHLAGILAGPAVGYILDKYGVIACVSFPICAAVVTAILGFPLPALMLTVTVFMGGIFVIGTQGILTAATPMFYPTVFRAKGNGIAMGIAKIGSILGPLVGGFLMTQLALGQLFWVNSGVIIFAALLFLILGIYSRSFFVNRVEEESINKKQEGPKVV